MSSYLLHKGILITLDGRIIMLYNGYIPDTKESSVSFSLDHISSGKIIPVIYQPKDAQKFYNELLEKLNAYNAENTMSVEIKESQLLAQLKPLLNNPIQQKTTIQLSPIVVDKHYKITLPEFGNIEIKLHALPKALYLLFLKHPEGIRFKELFEYKQELSDIYNKLSNQTDKKEIERAIKDLVDMTKPNINMQCSRIRAAFRKVMEESIAQHYYIDGQNGAPKKIALSTEQRHLAY